VPGVQIFACLDTVEPGGGGTLAVTGSHRLLNERVRISSGDLRKRLMKERYFAELMSNKRDDRLRFLREVGHMGNVALQVVEVTGEAGDVYFMDLRVLHTVAPHVNPTLSPGIVTDCTPWKISALSVIRKYANCDSS